MQGSDRSVELQPGPNRLAFQVTVLRQGLYSLKHVLARLGRLSLRLRAALPEDEGPSVELLTAPPLTGVLSEAQVPAQPAIGDVDPSGSFLALDTHHTPVLSWMLFKEVSAWDRGRSFPDSIRT